MIKFQITHNLWLKLKWVKWKEFSDFFLGKNFHYCNNSLKQSLYQSKVFDFLLYLFTSLFTLMNKSRSVKPFWKNIVKTSIQLSIYTFVTLGMIFVLHVVDRTKKIIPIWVGIYSEENNDVSFLIIVPIVYYKKYI